MTEERISVRNLVEFILREGDIDNRIGTFSEDALTEGIRLHKAIQKQAGSDYRAEVPLDFTYTEDDISISVEGRADGVISNETGITIDEIKTTYADVMRFQDAKPLHLAQAKFYAFIVADQNDLTAIKVRLTYVNIDTEETRYFNYTFLKEELWNFVSKVCHEYVKWARFSAEWTKKRDASINGLPFPFEYRKGQDELVKQVYITIKRKRKLFLEAPTGVGKTISTVYPSIQAQGQNLASKLFYLTAKTITRTVAEDTIDIMRAKGLSYKSITITAKEKICRCFETECNPEYCPYAKGHYDRVNDAVFSLISENDAITADKVIEYAERYMVCPFEMSLDASLFTDAIICDYNYAFDPRAKLKRYFEDETKAGNYLFLIDEAHNLVDRAREMYSATMYKEQFLELKKITAEELPGIAKKCEKCNKELLEIRHQCEDYLIEPLIGSFTESLTRLYSEIEKFLKDDRKPSERKKISREVRNAVLELYFEIGHFLKTYEVVDENYCVYASYDDENNFYVKLFCVNPRKNLSECMKTARSGVLFSATLLPIQYYKNLLAGETDDYEVYAESVFNPKKKGLFISRDVTSKYTRRTSSEYDKIAGYIHSVIEQKHGNYMVFFPSYRFLEDVYTSYETMFGYEDDIEIIVQSMGMREEEREAFLKRFTGESADDHLFDSIDADIELEEDATLIGFCVMGGIFSEGIDLQADSLIGAIIIGTGLPQVCLEREIMKNTFESEEIDGFEYAYRYPGMNKVLQSAGRVIRTEDDVGIVVLLDERFLQRSYLRMFPREWEDYKPVNLSNIGCEISKFWDEWT